MTTSGTATFLVSRDDIINAALRTLKVIQDGSTAGANDLTNNAFALNLILKSLDAEGYLKWCYQTVAFTLTANKASYTIAESGADVTNYNPLRIASAYRRDSSTPANDVSLSPLSRQQYEMLTPKTISGVPTQYYYDPQLTAGIFYPWPIPTDATYSARLLIQRPIQDITASTQNFDLPQEWFLPLRWMLADEVSEEYELDGATIARIQQRAQFWRNKMVDFAREDSSVLFQPDPQSTFHGFR